MNLPMNEVEALMAEADTHLARAIATATVWDAGDWHLLGELIRRLDPHVCADIVRDSDAPVFVALRAHLNR